MSNELRQRVECKEISSEDMRPDLVDRGGDVLDPGIVPELAEVCGQ